uniref:BED-type domain-containing protein n=1 Tax=Cucumis melo TaxID=3656 RepID=A0A9I9E8D2_CUCME
MVVVRGEKTRPDPMTRPDPTRFDSGWTALRLNNLLRLASSASTSSSASTLATISGHCSSDSALKAFSKIACNHLQKELVEWQVNPPAGFKHKVTDNLQRMTSFSVDETSNQSCSSPVLGKRKPVKPPSSVWEHVIKVEGCDFKYPRAACKHCGASYACDSKRNGTTNLKRHLEKCKMYVNPLKDNVEGEGDSESSLMATSFTQENCRKMLARMVILDELPFKFVESEGFHKFCRALNPKFVIPSREDCAKIWTNKVEEAFRRLCDDYYMRMSKEKYSQTQSCTPIEGFGFQSQSEISSMSSSGSYKARATVHDRFKQSSKTCLDDAKTEVTRYLDEAHIDCMGDEYLDLLTWWKVNSSRFKIISQVARDIYSIPISTMPSESAFSTGGWVLDSFRSSLTPQTAEALICVQNWIQSKPLDDMTEEIDGSEEIDEEFINIGKEMEAAFENLNNDSMKQFGYLLAPKHG